MKSPYARNGKEVSHHMILKKAFGYSQEITKVIKQTNDGGFRSNASYDRRRQSRTRRHGSSWGIYSKGNSLYGGYSSRHRLLQLAESVPSIGNEQLKLKTLPKRWETVYGDKF